MTDNDVPYYFVEAFEPRTEPTPRERALGFDENVRAWLQIARYATAESRLSHEQPMHIERILLTFANQPAVELAGAFLMTAPLNGYVLLYTPAFGLMHFASYADLEHHLSERLAIPTLRDRLMAFVARAQRLALSVWTTPRISYQPINGSPFKEVSDTIEANKRLNLQALQSELLELPTLATLLARILHAELTPLFPGWNQSTTRMITYRAVTTVTEQGQPTFKQPITSQTLEQTLLAWFRLQRWPAELTFEFVDSAAGRAPYTATSSENLQWRAAISRLGANLPNRLHDQLQHYWNAVTEPHLSRLEVFSQTLMDGYQTGLLKELESGHITGDDYQWFKTLSTGTSLQIDKLRLSSHKKPFMALAGYLVLSHPERSNSPVLLYRSFDTVRTFASVEDLHRHLLAPLDAEPVPTPLVDSLALKEHKDARTYESARIFSSSTRNPVTFGLMQIITDKQAHNLNYVMNLYRERSQPFDLAAVLDSVIDVRRLIDPQLLDFDTKGRWSTHLDLASLEDDAHSPEFPSPAIPLPPKEILTQQIQVLESLHHTSQQMLHGYPSLYYVAKVVLNEALWGEKLTLRPNDIFLNHYSSAPSSSESRPPLKSQDLVEYFIERMNGYAHALQSPQNWGAYEKRVDGVSQHIQNIDWPTLNRLVDTALQGFTTQLSLQHRHFYTRLIDTFKNTQLAALRNETRIKAQSHTDFGLKQNIVQCILDNPQQALRKSLNGFVPEVFGLAVSLQAMDTPVDLHTAFLITEHGGLDPEHSGCVLFWTPVAGLELAANLNLATQCLNERLADPLLRELFQNLQGYPERLASWHRHATEAHNLPRIHYRLIKEDFIEHLLHTQIESLSREVQHAVTQPLPAHQTQEWVNYSHVHHRFHLNLQHALNLAHDSLLQLAVPTWLVAAPAHSLLRLAGLIEQHHQQVQVNRDFLDNGLPDLTAFAHTRLLAQVEADRPDHGVDLEHFNVVTSPRSELPVTHSAHSLTELMLIHAQMLTTHNLRLISAADTPIPDWLTIDYLKQLHQRLNIGQHFSAILRPRLAPKTPGSAERCKLFSQHAPWQIIGHALSKHLQGQLSSAALNLIEQLMEMPEQATRVAVNGHKAVLRPLHLRHEAGALPSLLEGMYWISREIAQEGPRVLLTLLDDTFSLNEYSHEEGFLNQLRHSNSLQSLVLQRLPASVRPLFKAGHFLLAHLDAAGGSPHHTGNVLKKLYDDTCHLVLTLLGQQHAPHAQSAWDIAKAMFEATERLGSTLLLGKQRLPALAWHLLPQLLKAAKLAWQGEWKTAMSESAQILLQLALAKQMPIVQQTLPAPQSAALTQVSLRPVVASPVLAQAEALSTWHSRIKLTPAQEQRLRGYEVKHLELSDLRHDATTGVYTDPATHQLYAPVTGKTFRVAQQGQRWRIIGPQEKGPFLIKDHEQRWQLDLKGYLHGGGGALGKIFDPVLRKMEIRESFRIEASGMKKINRLYPSRAAIIRSSHERALNDLAQCQTNLSNPDVFAHPKAREFFKKLFGEHNLTAALRLKLQTMISTLQTDMLSKAMSPIDSERYVIGTLRDVHENSYAFVHPLEQPMKIYLTDLFFSPPLELLEQCLKEPFETVANARALSLIHEQTHISLSTLNIAYVDAILPRHELIDTRTELGREVYNILFEGQVEGLSTQTPESRLFRVFDPQGDLWDEPDTQLTKEIIQLTQTTNLAAARALFYSSDEVRMKVILRNADSLTSIVAALNRELVTPPTLPPLPEMSQEVLIG